MWINFFPKTQRKTTCISKSGRITLSKKEWRKLVEDIWFRAGGQCENKLANGKRCPNLANDPHHILWRSRGGSDSRENVAAACRKCHRAEHDGKMLFVKWNDEEFAA